jgi:ABC-type bacteriocin/lantibiotic exporter with double-glycine peptidase domain
VAGWKKVLDVLDTPVEVEDPRPGLVLPARALDIDVDRVSFAYHGGPPVLTEVSVAIPAGTRVALVGTTGSGKTTLAKLLIRLADPVGGSIRVAGTDLRQVSLASLRSARSVTPGRHLFDTSVAGSVTWAGPRPATARCGPPSRRWGWTAGSRAAAGPAPGSASAASTCRWASASWSPWPAATWPTRAA